jgi:hypothetical protein
MYGVIAEHRLAILMVVLLAAGAWLLRRLAPRWSWADRWLEAYRSCELTRRFLVWLLAISAAVHLGITLGHEASGYRTLYFIDTLALAWVTRRLVSGRPWRLWTGLTLTGGLLAYAISGIGGEAPDQVGLATKLVEITALAITIAPVGDRRLRRALASTAVVTLTVVVGIGAWAGAFQTGGHSHQLGAVPAPGVLLPAGEDRPPTHAEIEATEHFYSEVVEAIARYRDPAVAAADGYDVSGMYGTSFHASNATYQADDLVFDPERPETLVYAVAADGPVLLGAMFEMPGLRRAGPAIGGPLTVWHAHDHLCFGLMPPALAGFVSPFGGCALGAITIPMTPEMIHVWVLPGVEDRFGDIDEDWLNAYLAGDPVGS